MLSFSDDDAEDRGLPAHRDVEEARSSFFLPNCMTIAGLQHIMHNASQDVHLRMRGWKPFFHDLKNLEALLGVPERRQRFIFTCLRGTAFSHHEKALQSFSCNLYEARWHQVTAFVSAIQPLLSASPKPQTPKCLKMP